MDGSYSTKTFQDRYNKLDALSEFVCILLLFVAFAIAASVIDNINVDNKYYVVLSLIFFLVLSIIFYICLPILNSIIYYVLLTDNVNNYEYIKFVLYQFYFLLIIWSYLMICTAVGFFIAPLIGVTPNGYGIVEGLFGWMFVTVPMIIVLATLLRVG